MGPAIGRASCRKAPTLPTSRPSWPHSTTWRNNSPTLGKDRRPASRKCALPGRAAGKTAHRHDQSGDRLLAVAADRPALSGRRARVAARGHSSHGAPGRPRRTAVGARRVAPGRPRSAALSAEARQLLAAGAFVRRQAGLVLLQAARREELSSLRNQPRRQWTAAAYRQRVRRHRSDLPARRAHHVHHHAWKHVRSLRAVHLLVRAGPLRRRREERLPGQHQQRTRLCARAARRRPGRLLALGVFRQRPEPRAEPLDDQPGRHRHGRALGQSEHLARPPGRAAAHSRQRPRDVHRRRASQLVHRIDRDHRSEKGLQLPARVDPRHLGPAVGARSGQPAGRPARIAARTTRRGVTRVTSAPIRFLRRIFWYPPRAWTTSSAST